MTDVTASSATESGKAVTSGAAAVSSAVASPVPVQKWAVDASGTTWTLYFQKAKSTLLDSHRAPLEKIRELVDTGKVRIAIDGYASTDGDEVANTRLSLNRARAVLERLGLTSDDDRVVHVGAAGANLSSGEYGATEKERELRRSWNRCVVVKLFEFPPWKLELKQDIERQRQVVQKLKSRWAQGKQIESYLKSLGADFQGPFTNLVDEMAGIGVQLDENEARLIEMERAQAADDKAALPRLRKWNDEIRKNYQAREEAYLKAVDDAIADARERLHRCREAEPDNKEKIEAWEETIERLTIAKDAYIDDRKHTENR